MALNIKNPEVEKLISEVAEMTGESKTEAVRKALEERRERLCYRVQTRSRKERLMRFLEREIRPLIPDSMLGKERDLKEEEEILGYGPEGV